MTFGTNLRISRRSLSWGGLGLALERLANPSMGEAQTTTSLDPKQRYELFTQYLRGRAREISPRISAASGRSMSGSASGRVKQGFDAAGGCAV
jgi:hypothetical protein